MIQHCRMLALSPFEAATYGSLVAVEENETVPFPIQRTYYIYDVPAGCRRGFHAHMDLEQVLICISGQVNIHLRAPGESCEVTLDSPTRALYIGPMVWREMYDFSPGSVLLVLASKHYDPKDYIRDYAEFERLVKKGGGES